MLPKWIEEEARCFGIALSYGVALDTHWLYGQIMVLYNEGEDEGKLKAAIAERLAPLANGKSEEFAQAMLAAVPTSAAGIRDGKTRSWQIGPATLAALYALGQSVCISRSLAADHPLVKRFVDLYAFQSRWSSIEPRADVRKLIERCAAEAV